MPKDPQDLSEKPDSPKPPQKNEPKISTASASFPGAKPGRPVESRKQQYLIAARQAPGIQPLALDMLEENLRSSPEIEIVDTIAPRGVMGLFATGDSAVNKVLVAKMTHQAAGNLKQNAGPQLIVEQDQPLRFAIP